MLPCMIMLGGGSRTLDGDAGISQEGAMDRA